LDTRLQELAHARYSQKAFLGALFDLALDEQWFDLQHMVQHDMAKAIIADYSYEMGRDYLNQDLFFNCWEEVIDVGWTTFCLHTGMTREKVDTSLAQLREGI